MRWVRVSFGEDIGDNRESGYFFLLSGTVEQREYLDAYCAALHLSTLVLLESHLLIITAMGFL